MADLREGEKFDQLRWRPVGSRRLVRLQFTYQVSQLIWVAGQWWLFCKAGRVEDVP